MRQPERFGDGRRVLAGAAAGAGKGSSRRMFGASQDARALRSRDGMSAHGSPRRRSRTGGRPPGGDVGAGASRDRNASAGASCDSPGDSATAGGSRGCCSACGLSLGVAVWSVRVRKAYWGDFSVAGRARVGIAVAGWRKLRGLTRHRDGTGRWPQSLSAPPAATTGSSVTSVRKTRPQNDIR